MSESELGTIKDLLISFRDEMRMSKPTTYPALLTGDQKLEVQQIAQKELDPVKSDVLSMKHDIISMKEDVVAIKISMTETQTTIKDALSFMKWTIPLGCALGCCIATLVTTIILQIYLK